MSTNEELPNISTYPGLASLHAECTRLYPNQKNPLQLKTRIKFWQHGPDPLDYISIYEDPGVGGSVPPHWHYVSFGLSDLYGDGRVHPVKNPPNEGLSGFGFELTFRLRKDSNVPPVWPGPLLQRLATYVFGSGNPLIHGDHISWHHSLCGGESRIQHMLVALDATLGEVQGPFGTTKFVQLVGVTTEELEAVQHWNGPSFIELLKQNNVCGGSFLVTDTRRGESLFELDPTIRERVAEGIDKDGSNLSGVTAIVSWKDDIFKLVDNNSHLFSPEEIQDLEASRARDGKTSTVEHGRVERFDRVNEHERRMRMNDPSGSAALELGVHPFSIPEEESTDSDDYPSNILMPRMNQRDEDLPSRRELEIASCMQDLSMSLESDTPAHIIDELLDEVTFYDNIHISLNLEAALLVPLALKGRIRHGRHFTFKSSANDYVITIVAPDVSGSIVDATNKFAAKGFWLQIYLEESLIDKLLKDFEGLKKIETVAFPKTIFCLENKFALTITL